MPRLVNSNPKYQKHRASGQAVVRLNGHCVYLGPHGTKASRDEYDRVIAEWLTNGRQLRQAVDEVTVAELLAAYLRHAKTYYRNSDGSPGRELEHVKLSIPLLSKLYGRGRVSEFSPINLKAIREKMLEAGRLARVTINQRINLIRRIFRWGVSEDMVPPDVLQSLEAIDGLRRGRSEARESEPVKPVPEEIVRATIAHASPPIAAMVKLQLLTAMRPGEVVRMRTCDVDTTGPLWLYRPATHKTGWRGHDRVVYLGPKAQDALKPFLKLDAQAFIFAPAESEAWRREQLHLKRRTPQRYGNHIRTNRKRKPAKCAGGCYDVHSYRRAIKYACDAAFPAPAPLAKRDGETHAEHRARLTPKQHTELKQWRAHHRWNPNRVRHTAASNLRREYGLESAQVILGHKTLTVTQVYAEKNVEAAKRIMAAVG